MPWSNQNGGNGPWGGGSPDGGSPWKKNNDKGGSQNPWGKKSMGEGPDFDDLLRKGQSKLKQAGSGGVILLLIVIAILFWLYQCFYVVQQNERAVELRFGQPKEGTVTDGLHFRLWPIESYRTAPLTEQSIQIGGTASSAQADDGLMLSGDQNIVNVRFSVYYNIDNPVAYLFNVASPVGTVRQVAESAMREVVGRRPIDDVYRDKREDVARDVLSIIQSIVDKYDLGVRITRVSISEAAPPVKVAAAFNAVQQAEQERNRLIEEGNKFRATKLGEANGEASRKREEAAGEKASMIEEAQGRSAHFRALAAAAAQAPDMVRYRLYMETISKILAGPQKLILDGGENKPVTYLPLQELLAPNKLPAGTVSAKPQTTNLTKGQ